MQTQNKSPIEILTAPLAKEKMFILMAAEIETLAQENTRLKSENTALTNEISILEKQLTVADNVIRCSRYMNAGRYFGI